MMMEKVNILANDIDDIININNINNDKDIWWK